MACVAPPLLHSPPPVPLQPRGIDNDDGGLEEKEVGGGKEGGNRVSPRLDGQGRKAPGSQMTSSEAGGGEKGVGFDCRTNFCQKNHWRHIMV